MAYIYVDSVEYFFTTKLWFFVLNCTKLWFDRELVATCASQERKIDQSINSKRLKQAHKRQIKADALAAAFSSRSKQARPQEEN